MPLVVKIPCPSSLSLSSPKPEIIFNHSDSLFKSKSERKNNFDWPITTSNWSPTVQSNLFFFPFAFLYFPFILLEREFRIRFQNLKKNPKSQNSIFFVFSNLEQMNLDTDFCDVKIQTWETNPNHVSFKATPFS